MKHTKSTGMCNHHLGCLIGLLYSSVVPGILPSQLGFCSLGQTYFHSVDRYNNYHVPPCLVLLELVLAGTSGQMLTSEDLI